MYLYFSNYISSAEMLIPLVTFGLALINHELRVFTLKEGQLTIGIVRR